MSFYYENKIKSITYKTFKAYLSYDFTCYSKCNILFDYNFKNMIL